LFINSADKRDTIEDLALLTGAKVIDEELGDDLDLIRPDCLGEVVKSVTDNRTTVLTTGLLQDEVSNTKVLSNNTLSNTIISKHIPLNSL
jgi:hypothetical protein